MLCVAKSEVPFRTEKEREREREKDLTERKTVNELEHMFRPSLSVSMSFYHIACCSLWTSGISFLVTLRNFLDLRRTFNFNYKYVQGLNNEQM